MAVQPSAFSRGDQAQEAVSQIHGTILKLYPGLVFALISLAHLRRTGQSGASRPVLVLKQVATSLAILLFCWYTLLTAPQTFVILIVTVVLAGVVEAIWRRLSRRTISVDKTATNS